MANLVSSLPLMLQLMEHNSIRQQRLSIVGAFLKHQLIDMARDHIPLAMCVLEDKLGPIFEWFDVTELRAKLGDLYDTILTEEQTLNVTHTCMSCLHQTRLDTENENDVVTWFRSLGVHTGFDPADIQADIQATMNNMKPVKFELSDFRHIRSDLMTYTIPLPVAAPLAVPREQLTLRDFIKDPPKTPAYQYRGRRNQSRK